MKLKKLLSLTMALLVLLSLCACGSSAKTDYAVQEPAMGYNYSNAGGFAAAESAAVCEDGYYSEPASAGAATSGEKINPDKIIYSGSATIETTEFDAAVAALEEMVKGFGGYIQSSDVSGSNYSSIAKGYAGNRSANYTIRVPGERFAEAMGSLSGLGNVPYSSTSSENISARYYDTQARMEAYKAQEQSLIAMMEKAETVSDLIAIEERLSEVRYQIESLQTTLNGWDRQVSYSTISLYLQEVKVYTPAKELSFGEKLVQSFRDGLEAFGDFLQGLALWLAESWLFLLLLAAVIFGAVKLIRRSAGKRKARRAARYGAPVPPAAPAQVQPAPAEQEKK